MRFTRVIVTAVVAVIVLFVGALVLIPYFTKAPIDAQKLVSGLERFGRDHRAAGKPFPTDILLSELLSRGYVSSNDVRGLHGTDVNFSLTPNPANNQAIVIRATLPDGTSIAGLIDGPSVSP